ncbi:MAG: hypothetical protein LBO74_14845 [Candidatus Symbiothrix sp.]|nr:hypothetical protein [Candidatus Symbiothrix sp.]
MKVKKIPAEIGVPKNICGLEQYGILEFNTELSNIEFEFANANIANIDTVQIKGYILCVKPTKGKNILTVSGEGYISKDLSVDKITASTVYRYEIIEKKDIPKLIKDYIKRDFKSSNNYLSLQLGKGISYSLMGGGFGAALEYRFGEKTGWGLQVGGGYYNIPAPEHPGTKITEGSYSTNEAINYPHFSISLKNYPLLRVKEKSTSNFFPSLARNFYLGASYGILGSKKFEPYNNTDGSFSLGGTRTMHGVSMMVGEDYQIPFKGQESFGYMLSGGLGAAYSTNLKTWKFAYNVGFGIYWKFNRK